MDPVMNVEEWQSRIGSALRDLRLQRNLGQHQLATRAGIARSAVQNLESGRGTIATLIRAVRALGREDWLASLANQPTINPLHMTRSTHKRQRASRTRRGNPAR
jgi:transcriptional regulator with XRE-family HTH domain